MTLKEKALFHAQKAMEIQERVKAMEDKALSEARVLRTRRRNSSMGAQTADAYYQSQILKDDFWYRTEVSSRNAHQTMAMVFGIAALVEALP